MFGRDVRGIVEGETKVSKLPKMARELNTPDWDAEREQVENMRSMFVAMAGDWRVVVVKLADRLHNMRTLEFMPPKKRTRIARETLEIFAPLAHRLGIWTYKTELEDAAFRHLSISASRCVETPSRRRRDSCPSHNEVGGFFFDFEAIRTETAMLRAGIPGSTWRWIRLSKVVENVVKRLWRVVDNN